MKKSWIKTLLGGLCLMSILFGTAAPTLSVAANSKSTKENEASIIEPSDIPLRLHYDEEASHGVDKGYDDAEKWFTMSYTQIDNYNDDDWERWSLPIGNGYFGANLFGRTETERIQISEQSLYNTYKATAPDGTSYEPGGYNSFSETYIDFGHTNSAVSNYSRWLDIKTAISGVQYDYDGVTYSREYFTSYPDKILVIRLDASKSGKLNFTLRPTVAWEQEYAQYDGDGYGKHGTVTSYVADNGDGMIELSGKMDYYDIDFLGIYHVVTKDGSVSASTCINKDGDTDGTITVSNATSAYIYVNIGTDYVLSEDMFTTSDKNKPTFKTDIEYTRAKVEAEASAVAEKLGGKTYDEGYEFLKSRHFEDYDALFGRVSLDLGSREDAELTTDELLEKYENGDYSQYLEALFFQYGRYLLISSSRENSLPANLQGVWNRYNKTPWSGGYWHNINIQMNYWPAFSTNIAETFEAYVKYNQAYMSKAESLADYHTNANHADVAGQDGGNGWCIGIGTWPYSITGDTSPGNLGFTTQLYWEYYQYTKDETILSEIVYPILTSAARFIVKSVEEDENGNYLVSNSDSPEMHVNGVWYRTKGTTYAQTFAYLNNYNALCAAKDLGIDLTDPAHEDYAIFKTVMEQIDKYDPIIVGLSGQIKEFREEDYYCSLGDEPNHRHISQLVGLYPGNIINSTTPAWLDAAKVTLTNRGDESTGWSTAHKMNAWARTKDGERAHELLVQLLSEDVGTNLWTLHPPFQIDANLGGTAGISEMLLQSHEGYIAPLAAIPELWDSGSYTGLVARGNFEVSAAWENGTATVFNIMSKMGEKAVVYYPSITGATVVTSSGKKIEFSVEGKDMISFDTAVGETYIISGFKAQEKIDAPGAVSYTRDGRFGAFNLNWLPVANAVSYNLYVAVESAPVYTLVGNTDSLSMTYIPNGNEENARTTFAVTAVSASGSESGRILCYYNPEDTSAVIESVSASVSDDNELQILVTANGNTGKFKVYEQMAGSSEYTLIEESGFPILYVENYNKSSKYYVSAISAYTMDESKLQDIGSVVSANLSYDSSNILSGKEFIGKTGSDYSLTAGYEYNKLTDGIIDTENYANGRFSTRFNKKADATIDLGGTYILSELRFYLFERKTVKAGTNFTVQVYSEGQWINVVENVSNDELASKYCKSIGSGKAGLILSFDLGLIKGSKIRFYSESCTNDGITYYEAECAGIMINDKYAYQDNILLGKTFTGTQPTSYHSGAGGDVFTYDKLTDGVISSDWKLGRYSSQTNGKMNGTVDLGGVYKLDKIRIYDFEQKIANVGNDFKIEICYNGAWKQIVHVANNADLINYRVSNGTSAGEAWFEFDLNGALAQKIRISATAVTSHSVTLYEVECSGAMIYEYGKANDNVFSDKTFVGSEPTSYHAGAGGDVFTYDKLTDGVISSDWKLGRYSSQTNGKMNGVIDLAGLYKLDKIRVYDFEQKIKNMGNNFKIELYYNGSWTEAVYVENNADLAKYRVSNGTTAGNAWFEFDLGSALAEKVRITAVAVTSCSVTLYEIQCLGSKVVFDILENEVSNVLKDEDGVINGGNVSEENPSDHMFDGDFNTYTEILDTASYSVTVDLGRVSSLYTLKIYELIESRNLVNGVLSTASDDTAVEVYRDGQWIRIADNISLSATEDYTEINLYGTECSMVRITFSNTRLFDTETSYRSTKIKEITCTVSSHSHIDRKAMLEAYKKLIGIQSTDESHISKMAEFKAALTNAALNADGVEAYTLEMISYAENYIDSEVSKVDFVPKTSITLDRNLVYNVYVPVLDELKYFVLDGVRYNDFESIKEQIVTLSDGKQYYHFEIELSASEAGRNVVLEASISVESNDYNGTWTMNVPKYAEKVIATGNAVEAQLVKDILSYVRAAYVYFDVKDDAVISKINNILGENYDGNNEPALDGSATAPTNGLTAATYVLSATPAIRFYVSDANNKYEFYADGVKLNTISGSDADGNYLEMDVYAYAMGKTITYTINGIESGSYHINSYYTFVTTDEEYSENTNLINLVARFAKYCESAELYRENVTKNN